MAANSNPNLSPDRYAFACAIFASMTSVLLGYDIGVMGGAAQYIKEDMKISHMQMQILVETPSLFGAADWIGRQYTIVVAGAIFFVGVLLMGFATNYAFLMVARFVAGLGVSIAFMIVPVYTAEVSPTGATPES